MEKNPAVPLLCSDNYYTWSLKIKSVLTLKRLSEVIENEKPADLKQAEETEWNLKNADAVAYIQLSLSDDYSLQFADENNAKNLWNKIKQSFTGKIEDRKIDASNEIKNIEMSSEEKINDYIARVRGLKTKCTSLGLDITERELVFYTVRGLRGKFSKVKEILKTQRDKDMDEVLEILREEENTLQKQPNYKREEAFQVKNANRNNSKLCFICKRNNHVAKNCFYKNKNNFNFSGSDAKRTVPVNNKFKNSNNSSKNNQGRSNSKDFALTSNQEIMESPEDDIWILDSGCSAHMCNNIKYFINLNREDGFIHLAGKNSTLMSKGVGTIKVKTIVNNSENILTIHDVLFVPDLRSNLISVTKLLDKSLEIQSENNDILVLSENNDIVLKAVKVNNRLEIDLKPYNDMPYESLECNLVKNSDLYEMWHKRLCHLNPQYMLKMQNAIGTNFKDFDNFICESCDISKVTRKNHPKINVDQSSSILELLHIDLAGPINVDSLGNSKYFLVIVDDFSGMYFTYFLKHKYEVFDVFTVFKERYENLMSKRIKRLKSDNGLEFTSSEMDTFLEKCGIIHEKTVPYNPESNGKAERAIRVLVERARTLLYESKLPLKFWAEAISCCTHISNLTPRKNKEKTPIEIWTGREPKLSYLKTFGCVAYYYIPKQFRGKFEVPAKRGIFVGYSRERRAYRIYDIDKNKVIEERSVKFDETIKGSNFLKNKSENYLWDIGDLTQFNESEREINSLPMEMHDTDNSESDFSSGEMLESNQNQRDSDIITNHSPQLRRSVRIKNKTSANLAGADCLADADNLIPKKYEEIKNNKNRTKWELAMKNELDSLNKHKVWEIVSQPENQKIKLVKSKWVYSLKEDNSGDIKYKARLVAAGYNQIKNKDYAESYSPVVNIESFRLLIALAAKLNLMIKFFDVKTAYLYSNLEESVYMTAPPGYENVIGTGNVCKLNKSLYGLPQSGRNWFMKIKSELEKLQLIQLASDNCVFMKTEGESIFILCMYVDDLSIFYNNEEMYESIMSKIKNVFELHENKNSKFLGLEIQKHENGISLSQTEYIQSLLVKHNMEDCKPVKTPIVKGEDKSFPLTNQLIDITMYQEIIGELLYLSNRTRPDISFVTSYLSQFNHKPEKRHYLLAKRVLRYLQGTKYKKLFFSNEFGFLNASSDASWGNGENGKSFSGNVILLGNSLISWKCHKQKSVSLSTCEAELFAIAEVCKDIVWIVGLLSELKCEKFINGSVNVSSDSQAAIQWIGCARSSNKSRHMNLRFHFIKDLVIQNIVKLEYVQSEYIISDFLTKAVNEDKILYSLDKIALIS